jgi:putative tryptophan/tyrosine transport system substrate-binding protein
MRRREFIAGLGSVAAWPVMARAQQGAVPVIGFLNGGTPAEWAHLVAAFNQGLNETGFVGGRNVAIEYRWALGQFDRLPELAADLVRHQVAVIASTGGANSTLALRAATGSIPIVFVHGTDPVDDGFVTRLSRPDANLTGISMFSNALAAKRQELLHQLVPMVPLVAVLVNPAASTSRSEVQTVQAAAEKIGQRVRIFNVSTDSDIDAAFATIVEQRIGGLIVSSDLFLTSRRDLLVLLTTRHAIPTIFAHREFVTAGGLMSYGTSLTTAYRLAGTYVGRILKGAKPADLPVQQSTTFETVLNLKAAKALGITIPETLLATADEVIQ